MIGNKDYELETVEEAFTSENWIVRIYRVKKFLNRGHKAWASVGPNLGSSSV